MFWHSEWKPGWHPPAPNRMPETIGLAILSAIGVADVAILGTTVMLSSVVGAAALTGILIGVQFLLPRPEMPKQENGSQALRQSIPPRNGAYGRVRLGGSYMLYEVSQGVSLDVLAVVSGKIGGFVGYYLHEDLVEIDNDGLVQEFEDGRYGDGLVQIRTRIGDPTETAYSEVTDVLPSEIWSTDHRGDGIASVMLRCTSPKTEDIQKRFPQGLPEPSFIIDGYPIWDPREEGQSRSDPDTWTVSTNPVLQLLDYLTHPDHGMGLDYDALIAPVIDQWIEEADLCDEQVARKVGTEKRYESAGWYTFDTKPESVIGSILSSCDGWLAENGDGTLAIQVGVYREPDEQAVLKAKHILAFGVNYGVTDEERVNEIAISFTSPEHRYKDTQLQPWRDEDDISESGVTRSQAISYGWVQSHPQARRLAKRTMARLKPTMRGTIVTTLYGLAVLGKRWVRLQYPTVSGLEDAIVEIQEVRNIDLMAGRITFEWVKVDPEAIDAWSPETEEGDPPPVPELMSAGAIPAPQSVSAQIESGSLLVEFDNLGSGVANPDLYNYRVRYRVTGQTAWTTTSVLDGEDIGSGRMRINAGVVPETTALQVQVQTVAPSGASSDWAPEAPFEINTGGGVPGTPLNLQASEDGGEVTITWTNPNSPTVAWAMVYQGPMAPPNPPATVPITTEIYSAPNQQMTVKYTPGASGTYNYWVTVANASGEESSPAGPAEVIIS